MGVTVAGPPVIGMGRSAANTEIGNLEPNPAGATSIGDGVFLASNTLAPVGGFDHKAIVVFTDGHENSSRYLSDPDVQAVINDRVFAIGLGTAANLNPAALDAIANSTGGFLMMTGAIGNDDLLRLHKYFLQVLAGVTNTAVVVDPEGSIRPGQEHRIPFHLSEADIGADVILLSPAPWAIEFMLETPSGKVINAIDSASIPKSITTFCGGLVGCRPRPFKSITMQLAKSR
ncbi:MAG: vWA domain-containing protein, partial [Chloroflexota bacterium]